MAGMTKTGRSGSAAQRREQERQQRQRREEARVSILNKGKAAGQGPTRRKKDRGGLYMVIGVLVLIAAIIVAFAIIRNLPTPTNPALQRAAADPAVVRDLTSVPPSTWTAVGKGSVTPNGLTYQSGQPPLTGPKEHPQFFYVGGEFCPYCGAQRWAMINALSRFGTFNHLSQIQAAEGNIPTFSFYGSSYSSQYVDFVPREIKGNALDKSQLNYVELEKLTPAEQQTFQKYDSAQSFPFVDIGNQYIWIGAGYDLSILLDSKGNPLSWQTIASSLSDPKSTFAQGILGTANYLTAGICNLTKQQPADVCNVPVIQQIRQAINKAPAATPIPTLTPTPTKTSRAPGGGPLAVASTDLLAARRQIIW